MVSALSCKSSTISPSSSSDDDDDDDESEDISANIWSVECECLGIDLLTIVDGVELVGVDFVLVKADDELVGEHLSGVVDSAGFISSDGGGLWRFLFAGFRFLRIWSICVRMASSSVSSSAPL